MHVELETPLPYNIFAQTLTCTFPFHSTTQPIFLPTYLISSTKTICVFPPSPAGVLFFNHLNMKAAY